jgi:hypothetical protein
VGSQAWISSTAFPTSTSRRRGRCWTQTRRRSSRARSGRCTTRGTYLHRAGMGAVLRRRCWPPAVLPDEAGRRRLAEELSGASRSPGQGVQISVGATARLTAAPGARRALRAASGGSNERLPVPCYHREPASVEGMLPVSHGRACSPRGAPGPGGSSISPRAAYLPHRSQRRSGPMLPPQPAWMVSRGGPPGVG